MSNAPVVSVTDELIAELERASTFTNRFMVEVQPGSLARILSERAELKRDAERLNYMIREKCTVESQNGMASPVVYRLYWRHLGEHQAEWYPSERAAIDAAMQS